MIGTVDGKNYRYFTTEDVAPEKRAIRRNRVIAATSLLAIPALFGGFVYNHYYPHPYALLVFTIGIVILINRAWVSFIRADMLLVVMSAHPKARELLLVADSLAARRAGLEQELASAESALRNALADKATQPDQRRALNVAVQNAQTAFDHHRRQEQNHAAAQKSFMRFVVTFPKESLTESTDWPRPKST